MKSALILSTFAAVSLAAATVAMPSPADARSHHRAYHGSYGYFGGAYAYSPRSFARGGGRGEDYRAYGDRQLTGRDWCC